MKIRKVINEVLGDDSEKGSVAGGIHAVISANVNEPGSSHVSSKQRTRVVQRKGNTEVYEETFTSTDEGTRTSRTRTSDGQDDGSKGGSHE